MQPSEGGSFPIYAMSTSSSFPLPELLQSRAQLAFTHPIPRPGQAEILAKRRVLINQQWLVGGMIDGGGRASSS